VVVRVRIRFSAGSNVRPRMAQFHTDKLPLFLAGILSGLLAIAGCETSSPAVDALPPPSFDAPCVMAAPLPAPVAVAPRPAPVAMATPQPPAPREMATAGIPMGWVPPVPPRPWKAIVIHHSATTFGNAAIIDQWHRDRGFDELGYHFVIGNGTNSADGQVEVGPRWPIQKYGAHDNASDNRYNEYGIGICLVGNFDVQHPSAAQMRSVDTLVAWLMKRYKIAPDHILGHGDTKQTDCPGKNLSVAEIRSAAVRMIADAGETLPQSDALASGQELLVGTPAK
jgi:N-acetylmuramoyl-L-alanine amidase